MINKDFNNKYFNFLKILDIIGSKRDRDYEIKDDLITFHQNNDLICINLVKNEFTIAPTQSKIISKIKEFSKDKDLIIPRINIINKENNKKAAFNFYYKDYFQFNNIYFDSLEYIHNIQVDNHVIKSLSTNSKNKYLENYDIKSPYFYINSKSLQLLENFTYANFIKLYEYNNSLQIKQCKNIDYLELDLDSNNKHLNLGNITKQLPKLNRIKNAPEHYKIYSSTKRSYIFTDEIYTTQPNRKIPFVYSTESNLVKKANIKIYASDIMELNGMGLDNTLVKKLLTHKIGDITDEDKKFIDKRDKFGNSVITYCLKPEYFKVLNDLGYEFTKEEYKKMYSKYKKFYERFLIKNETKNTNLSNNENKNSLTKLLKTPKL